jgi:hypothetical protein
VYPEAEASSEWRVMRQQPKDSQAGTPESRMPGNGHVRFGKGPLEKGSADHLAGGLLHLAHPLAPGNESRPAPVTFDEVAELEAALAVFTAGALADALAVMLPRLPTHRRIPFAVALEKLRCEPPEAVARPLARALRPK